MASRARKRSTKRVEDYRHDAATRVNNPTAALAREDVEAPPARKLAYDPHLPPELWWAGKDHDAEFEVEVTAYAKNERLFFEIPYRHLGRTRRYKPDFLISPTAGCSSSRERAAATRRRGRRPPLPTVGSRR